MITREDMIEQSVQNFAKDRLLNQLGYSSSDVVFEDSFPYTMPDGLQGKQHIAAGFSFDDGGEQAEMGSSLKQRLHTVQFWVFGTSTTWARNLASALKLAIEQDGTIPLLDLEDPALPIIDYLLLNDDPGSSSERQIIPEPEPWQEFVWTVHVPVIDTYYAAVV